MHSPACGFLRDDGTRCTSPAVRMARVEELNAEVPCCEDCGSDRQVSAPKEQE